MKSSLYGKISKKILIIFCLVCLVLYAVFIYVNNDLREFKFSMLKKAFSGINVKKNINNSYVNNNVNNGNGNKGQEGNVNNNQNEADKLYDEQQKTIDDTLNYLEQEDNFGDIID